MAPCSPPGAASLLPRARGMRTVVVPLFLLGLLIFGATLEVHAATSVTCPAGFLKYTFQAFDTCTSVAAKLQPWPSLAALQSVNYALSRFTCPGKRGDQVCYTTSPKSCLYGSITLPRGLTCASLIEFGLFRNTQELLSLNPDYPCPTATADQVICLPNDSQPTLCAPAAGTTTAGRLLEQHYASPRALSRTQVQVRTRTRWTFQGPRRRLLQGTAVFITHCETVALLLVASQLSFKVDPKWDYTLPCSGWKGVVCDSAGHVTSLSLPGALTGGILPVFIGQLGYLTKLDLSGNFLSGEIPTSWNTLRRLQILNLSNNIITGAMSPNFWGLLALTQLDLSFNFLDGQLPDPTSTIPSIQKMVLRRNGFSGLVPLGFRTLPQLTYLDLGLNQFCGSPFQGPVPSRLQTLLLDNNQFSGVLPDGSGSAALASYNVSRNYFYLSFATPCPSATVTADTTYNCLGNQAPQCFGTPQRSDSECAGFNNEACATPYLDGGRLVCLCPAGLVQDNKDPLNCINPANQTPKPDPVYYTEFVPGVVLSKTNRASTKSLNRWARTIGFDNTASTGSFGLVQDPVQPFSVWMAPTYLPTSTGPHLDSSFGGNAGLAWDFTRDQGLCGSCWADVVADTIQAGVAIAGNANLTFDVATLTAYAPLFPPLSEEQIYNCTSQSGACSGDLPENALDYGATHGLVTNDTWAAQETCPSAANGTGTGLLPQLVRYEQVQFNLPTAIDGEWRDMVGVLLTLQSSPVIAFVEGSSLAALVDQNDCLSPDFVFDSTTCYTGNIDHAVVVVGYDLTCKVPHWLVRNSWGEDWCQGGFFRMQIRSGDGVCGINVLPPLYPVPIPVPGDPCYANRLVPAAAQSGPHLGVAGPCGSGANCTARPDWGNYSYECDCSVLGSNFTAVNNTVPVTLPGAGNGVTQACVPVDYCSTAKGSVCGVGKCINTGMGDYTCACPLGFSAQEVYHSTTCVYGPTGTNGSFYTSEPGVTCRQIAASYSLTLPQLQAGNTNLQAPFCLSPGDVPTIGLRIAVASSAAQNCSVFYRATLSDIATSSSAGGPCKAISDKLQSFDANGTSVSVAELQALNPLIKCSQPDIIAGQPICIQAGTPLNPFRCGTSTPPKERGTTCKELTNVYFSADPRLFYDLNRGLDCDSLADDLTNNRGPKICLGQSNIAIPKCDNLKVADNTGLALKKPVAWKGATWSSTTRPPDNCLLDSWAKKKNFKDADSFLAAQRIAQGTPVKQKGKIVRITPLSVVSCRGTQLTKGFQDGDPYCYPDNACIEDKKCG